MVCQVNWEMILHCGTGMVCTESLIFFLLIFNFYFLLCNNLGETFLCSIFPSQLARHSLHLYPAAAVPLFWLCVLDSSHSCCDCVVGVSWWLCWSFSQQDTWPREHRTAPLNVFRSNQGNVSPSGVKVTTKVMWASSLLSSPTFLLFRK